jgi:hypothetical protein
MLSYPYPEIQRLEVFLIFMDPWAKVMLVLVEVIFILEACVQRIGKDFVMEMFFAVVIFVSFDFKFLFSLF